MVYWSKRLCKVIWRVSNQRKEKSVYKLRRTLYALRSTPRTKSNRKMNFNYKWKNQCREKNKEKDFKKDSQKQGRRLEKVIEKSIL